MRQPTERLPSGLRYNVSLIALALMTIPLAGCSGSGSSTPTIAVAPAPSPTPTPSVPQIASFTAAPGTINAGQSATLNFSVTGATSLSISGIGTVTGSSVTVTPTVTTSYVLTATNAAGSSTATITVTIGAFIADDVPIGDANISYVQIEISPDQRFMTFIEEGAGAGGSGVAWLCALDPATGTMIPADGRGFRIADIRQSGSPQWGQDASGFFSTTVDIMGRILIMRPTLNTNGTATGTVTPLATGANTSRGFPYPSRTAAGSAVIVYNQADPADSSRLQLFWTRIDNASQENQITSGPVAAIGTFNLPPFLVNIQRWFYDVAGFANGLPILTYGNTVVNPGGNQPLTLEQLDFATLPPVASRIAGITPQVLDPFPFLSSGERYVIGGLNAGPIGTVYRRDAAGQYSVEVSRLESVGSSLATPSNFASAEPFLRAGRVYTAYQLNNPGAPGTADGEIWFTSVFDRTVSRRISAPTASRRADPEFFFGTNKTWILYYARPGSTGNWQLRRADTGL